MTCNDVGLKAEELTVAVNVLYTLLACDIVDAIAVLRHFNRRVRTTVEKARHMSGKLFNVEQYGFRDAKPGLVAADVVATNGVGLSIRMVAAAWLVVCSRWPIGIVLLGSSSECWVTLMSNVAG